MNSPAILACLALAGLPAAALAAPPGKQPKEAPPAAAQTGSNGSSLSTSGAIYNRHGAIGSGSTARPSRGTTGGCSAAEPAARGAESGGATTFQSCSPGQAGTTAMPERSGKPGAR